MLFRVVPREMRSRIEGDQTAFLIIDNWDDFGFKTLYSLIFILAGGARHKIGNVKIGQFSMNVGQIRPNIPEQFDSLDSQFFSLGQDDSYYENLNILGYEIRNEILLGLRDFTLDHKIFEQALVEKVTSASLLRFVTPLTVIGQYTRIAKGGARLSRYNFAYTDGAWPNPHTPPIRISFMVEPESHPPTNIHVIIGRNGVGKTFLLNNMAGTLINGLGASRYGSFISEDINVSGSRMFASLVLVTFSAFDSFELMPIQADDPNNIKYHYIGLKSVRTISGAASPVPKTPEQFSEEFANSVRNCRHGVKNSRWRRALATLEADPIFKDAEVVQLADEEFTEYNAQIDSQIIFHKLSSGHKIVLLTITRLIETVEERTLVLIDEPEVHLHPPLLSAFVRALSDLLVDRNGVAIIATHSPVVLQEVPRSCAWKIRRTGSFVEIERPEIETFGENVGILTREIFGLEVTHSGFHRLLKEAVYQNANYDDIVDHFGDQLGSEAKAIIRALIATKSVE